MLFSYGYGWWQNWQWHQNVPPLGLILKALQLRQCYAVCIAWCSMSRATPEATGRSHWATTCSVLLLQPPGQQQTKQWCHHGTTLLAILMATAVCKNNTACNAWWRRFRASLEATRCHHWVRIEADSSNQSRIRRYVFEFFFHFQLIG